MFQAADTPIAWRTSRIADRLGFDLGGWQVGYSGDEAGLASLRNSFPRADVGPLDAASAGQPLDLVLIAGGAGLADLPATAAQWLPSTRWLAATLPDAPGHWEALDALPVVHRFVYEDLSGGNRSLHIGYVLQGERQQRDMPIRAAKKLLLPASLEPRLGESGLNLLFITDRSWTTLLCGDYYDPVHVRILHSKPSCDGPCDAHFDPTREHVVAAARRSFPDWEPHAVVLVCPEYTAIPPGLEDSPWPTIAAISDWNVNFRDLVECLGVFDLVVGDSNGMQLLRALGFPRAAYWPMYSFDPTHHKPAVGQKAHDLAFLGNLNHRVQRERSRYLHEVAKLSASCKVLVGGGFYGADYAGVLQASRLVFNRSIRGELNLRCYEAPACGSLLLIEDINDEARSLYTPGEHCVYYGPDDLPDVVEEYLRDPATAARVTAAGTARARESSYTAHFSGLLAMIRDLLAAPMRPRPFAALPAAERLHRLGRLAYHRTLGDRHLLALELLGKAHDAAPQAPAIAADLAAVLASLALEHAKAAADPGTPDPQWCAEQRDLSDAKAQRLISQALAAQPDQPVWLLMAARLAAEGDPAGASALLQRILESDAGETEGLIYPLAFSHLEVELETASHSLLARPAERAVEMRKLISWQAAAWLADLAAEGVGGTPDPATALQYYQLAADLRPDLAETQIKLGNVLLGQEDPERAAQAFRKALDDNPLSLDACLGLVTALMRAGESREATAFYDECLSFLPAVPSLFESLPELQRTYWEAMTVAEATKGWGADRLQLEGLRATNYLLFAEGENWLAGLEAYAQAVPPEADACLVLYSANRPAERLLAAIEAHLAVAGLDPEALADILVVDRSLTPRQEQELIRLVDGVYTGIDGMRAAQVQAAGKPVVADFRQILPT